MSDDLTPKLIAEREAIMLAAIELYDEAELRHFARALVATICGLVRITCEKRVQ